LFLVKGCPQRKGRKDMVDDTTGGGIGGRRGERATGTPNTIYDLSSVLFHALEGGASYDTYIEDAEGEGDQELADFFRRVRDEDSMRADEAQRLLAERTPTTTASTTIEPVEGPTAPNVGLAAGAPMWEETTGRVRGRPDMDAAATDPGIGGAGQRVEPDVPPRTEEVPPPRTSGIEEGILPRREEAPPPRTGSVPPGEGAVTEDVPGDVLPRTEEDAPLGREGASRQPEGEREEDKGLIDRAKDAILGEEEEEPRRRSREGTDRADRR
jgi:hypothetical protein